MQGLERQLQQEPSPDIVLELLLAQCRSYVQQQRRPASSRLFFALEQFESVAQARVALSTQREVFPEVAIVDCRAEEAFSPDPCGELLGLGADAQPKPNITPHSAVVFLGADEDAALARSRLGNQHVRVAGEGGAWQRADLVRVLMEHVDHAYLNRVFARWSTSVDGPGSVAAQIAEFMDSNWSQDWDFHFYTGSLISGFIHSMHQLIAGTKVGVWGGRTEHQSATSAMAGWQLHGRPYVIAVTSGMIDEFRGTLVNLKRARAPGLVVCADNAPSTWYSFQGTIDGENDGPRQIEARGLDQVFIAKAEDIGPRLAEAFEKLVRRPGPVFVFATQAALEAILPSPEHVQWPAFRASPCRPEAGQAQAVERVLQLLNEEPTQWLWQCGRLTPQERELVIDISERAGIALTDSLAHPGTVGEYHEGRRVPQYLGSMSMYAFSRRIYNFLHTDHRLNRFEQQAVLFLKSRIDQSATPFSEAKLKRNMRVVQVTHTPEHIAPFTSLGLVMDALPFLQQVACGLAVRPDVLQMRRAKLAALADMPEAVVSDYIPTEPVSANHFFLRLGALVRRRIEQHGYRYIGVYDVGRGSISAVRNVPRTDQSFSAWYGRALMGDGNMALPYIVSTAAHDVLAFVGDGARAMVPDIERDIVAALASRADVCERNVTVFYVCNGTLSMIQTFLDRRYGYNGVEQVAVQVPPAPAVGAERRGPVEIRRLRLTRFDEDVLDQALAARGRLNIIETVQTHNSDGDGLSLASETTWNRYC